MTTLKREDFVNKNEVRWCPGCGDYAILAALQKVLPELGRPPHEHVFVSGIGCSGRLPYYMNTYGFHTIHGRAFPAATGLALMRPELAVWVITGDGDGLSIGGNHLMHCLRRNIPMNILLINNQIYGLTKGQFSPTSPKGQVTKTSPDGVEAEPLNPLVMALAAGASFVARAVDKDPAHLAQVLKAAYEHKGTSFVEIYQDCNIFNHGVFDGFALKQNRPANTVLLEDKKPLRYGAEKEHVLSLIDSKIIRDNDSQNPMVHDVTNWQQAMLLAQLQHPEFPVPLGVLYQKQKPMLDLHPSVDKQPEDLRALFASRASWVE